MSDDIHITCPKCNTILDQVEASGVTADVCPACSGVWLDHGELEKLHGTGGIVEIERASTGRRAVPPSFGQVRLSCPVCTDQLVTLAVGDETILLDGCPGCGGLWLDRGELALALDAVGASGDPGRIQHLARAVAARR